MEKLVSQYHIITNHDRTFTAMSGRAVISNHRSYEVAKRVIARLVERAARAEALDGN